MSLDPKGPTCDAIFVTGSVPVPVPVTALRRRSAMSELCRRALRPVLSDIRYAIRSASEELRVVQLVRLRGRGGSPCRFVTPQGGGGKVQAGRETVPQSQRVTKSLPLERSEALRRKIGR